MVNRRILFIGLVAAVCGASLVGAASRADDLGGAWGSSPAVDHSADAGQTIKAGKRHVAKDVPVAVKVDDFQIDWQSVPKQAKSRFKPAGCELVKDEPPVLSDKHMHLKGIKLSE